MIRLMQNYISASKFCVVLILLHRFPFGVVNHLVCCVFYFVSWFIRVVRVEFFFIFLVCYVCVFSSEIESVREVMKVLMLCYILKCNFFLYRNWR